MAHPSEFFKPKPKPAAAEPAHVAGHPRDFFKTDKPEPQPVDEGEGFSFPKGAAGRGAKVQAEPPVVDDGQGFSFAKKGTQQSQEPDFTQQPSPDAAAALPREATPSTGSTPPPTVPLVAGASIFGKKSGGVIDGEVDVIYLSPNGKKWAGFPWVSLTFVEWIESSGDEDDTITFIFGKTFAAVSGKRLSRLAEIIQTRKVARVSPSVPSGEFKKEEWVRKVEITQAQDEEEEDE